MMKTGLLQGARVNLQTLDLFAELEPSEVCRLLSSIRNAAYVPR